MAVVGDFTNMLGGLKSWPALQPLDYIGFEVAAGHENFAWAGRVGALNATNKWTGGVAGTTTTLPMPLFLLSSLTDFTVSTSSSNSFGASAMPTGHLGALVGVGAFELYTTEFKTGVNYVPGQPLKAPTAAQTSNNVNETGRLFATRSWTGGDTNAVTVGTDTIVGITSFGRKNAGEVAPSYANYSSPFGRNEVLAFWPSYHAGTQ